MKKIKIEAIVNGNQKTVWDAWTNPEHITKWNFATDDWRCPSAANDLKVGGKYSARMEAKDGSFGFDFVAIYNEIVPQKKLTYTMTDGRTATTDFESIGKQVRITTAFDAEKKNSEELQKNGWQAILNNFKKYVEAM